MHLLFVNKPKDIRRLVVFTVGIYKVTLSIVFFLPLSKFPDVVVLLVNINLSSLKVSVRIRLIVYLYRAVCTFDCLTVLFSAGWQPTRGHG